MKANLLVIMGGSGSGKTTVAQKLEEYGYCKLVTTTTRPMREGEVDGRSYYFVSEEEFWRIPKVEFAKYDDHWYGLSQEEIRKKGQKYEQLVVVLEATGAEKVKELYGNKVTVVFLRISEKEMRKRLTQRQDSQGNIQNRIRWVIEQRELEPPSLADIVIDNESLDKTVKKILEYQKKKLCS